MWRGVTPQLFVSDVAKSAAWYRDVLGFETAWARGESFAAVRGGNVELFLARTESPGTPATVCLLVDDADFAYALCRERNAPIAEPIVATAWGTREFVLCDPDGNRLRIGHSTRR